MKQAIKRLKHPLLIFLVLGTLGYFVYSALGNFIESKNKKIVVGEAQLDILREDYKRTWNRYPTDKEMQNQINGHIMDEIFYKEAVVMGLDKSDIAVKKRLRQLMEMMLDDYTTVYATEQQLRDYLNANPDKFREDPSISFSHLYFKVDEKETALKVLTELEKGASIKKFQKYSLLMLPIDFYSETLSKVSKQTGKEFSEQIFKLEAQKWQGPVPSVYGWHLVWVDKIEKGKIPDLNSVWDEVELEWSAQQKNIRKQEQYSLMREQYRIEVEELNENTGDNS